MKTERDILVVDDEPVIAQAVAKVCSSEGMSVDIEEHGAAGLARLKSRSYGLIICDLMMPEVDGFRFLSEAARRGVQTPIIISTGYATLENAVISLTRGAADFIPKPFTADELLTVVRRAFNYARLQKEAVSSAAGRPASLVYVPGPPQYYRLGYVSWVKKEPEGTVLIGVSDLFLKTIETVRELKLLRVGEETAQGGSCAAAISADGSSHSVMCPVSGRIVEVNASAASDPARVEKDPYFTGWLYRVLPSDLQSDLGRLISCSSDRI